MSSIILLRSVLTMRRLALRTKTVSMRCASPLPGARRYVPGKMRRGFDDTGLTRHVLAFAAIDGEAFFRSNFLYGSRDVMQLQGAATAV